MNPLDGGRVADVREVTYTGGKFVAKGERKGHFPFDPINIEFRLLNHLHSQSQNLAPAPICIIETKTHTAIAMEYVEGERYDKLAVTQTLNDAPALSRTFQDVTSGINNFFEGEPALAEQIRLRQDDPLTTLEDSLIQFPALEGLGAEFCAVYARAGGVQRFYTDLVPSNVIKCGSSIRIIDFNIITFGKDLAELACFIDHPHFEGYREEMVSRFCHDTASYHAVSALINLKKATFKKASGLQKAEYVFHLSCIGASARVLGAVRLAEGIDNLVKETNERTYKATSH
jgi:hypothetical protein